MLWKELYIYIVYITDGSDLRYDGMVSFSRGTMRTKHAPKGRLVLLIGDVHRMTCEKVENKLIFQGGKWTSGGMVVIFQGGGNKKLADVGPWLRDKIVERFKQAILWDQDGPGEWQPWANGDRLLRMFVFLPGDHISLGDFLIVGTYGTCCPVREPHS